MDTFEARAPLRWVPWLADSTSPQKCGQRVCGKTSKNDNRWIILWGHATRKKVVDTWYIHTSFNVTFSWLIRHDSCVSESTSKSSMEQLWGSESMSHCLRFPDNRSKRNDMRKKLGVTKEIIWIWYGIESSYFITFMTKLVNDHLIISSLTLLDSARFFYKLIARYASPGRHMDDLLHWKKGLRSQGMLYWIRITVKSLDLYGVPVQFGIWIM